MSNQRSKKGLHGLPEVGLWGETLRERGLTAPGQVLGDTASQSLLTRCPADGFR